MSRPEIVRVEKRKWDSTLSSVEAARLVSGDDRTLAWFVASGTVRRRPERGDEERLAHDEIWLSVPGEWWVLCGHGGADGLIEGFELHAAVPLEGPEPGLVRWIDLDLDLELEGDEVELVDEAEFHEHARTMHYPDEVIRGAWSGISRVAPRYTTGEWPFDGWLEQRLREARSDPAA